MLKPINYISVFVVAMFYLNSRICDCIYLNDINSFTARFPEISNNPYNNLWWILRTNIYSACFMTAYYASTFNRTAFSTFVFSIGVGVAFNDFLDRIRGINRQTESDIFIAILTVAFAIYNYKKCLK